MTDNELIATHIMGWHRKGRISCVGGVFLPCQYWCDDTTYQVRDDLWRPDVNLSQAMQVAEAMRQLDYDVSLYLVSKRCQTHLKLKAHACEVSTYFPKEEDFRTIECADRLESAIHAAAVQVARAMEANDGQD